MAASTNSSGDTILDGIVVSGPDAFWQPNYSDASILNALGVPSIADAASLWGFYATVPNATVGASSVDSYSGMTADEWAQEQGYTDFADYAVSQGYLGNVIGELELLDDPEWNYFAGTSFNLAYSDLGSLYSPSLGMTADQWAVTQGFPSLANLAEFDYFGSDGVQSELQLLGSGYSPVTDWNTGSTTPDLGASYSQMYGMTADQYAQEQGYASLSDMAYQLDGDGSLAGEQAIINDFWYAGFTPPGDAQALLDYGQTPGYTLPDLGSLTGTDTSYSPDQIAQFMGLPSLAALAQFWYGNSSPVDEALVIANDPVDFSGFTLTSDLGGSIIADTGGQTADQWAASLGYSSLSDMASQWFGDGSPNGEAQLLAYAQGENGESIFGFASVFTPNNGVDPQTPAYTGGPTGFAGFATTQEGVVVPDAPPTTDAEKNALVGAIASGLLQPSDIASLVSETAVQSGDPAFVNNMIQALQASGNDAEEQSLYQAVLADRAGNNTLGSVAGIDFSNFSAAGLNLSSLNFDGLTGLTGANLNGATSLQGADLTGVNMAGFSAQGVNLANIDFTGATGLTGSMLNGATSLNSANLNGVNMAGFNATGIDLTGVNLSATTHLTGAQLVGATSLSGANLTGVNMAGFSGAGMNLDFFNPSSTTGFTAAMLNGASSLQSGNLAGINMTGFNANGINLGGTSFRGATGITGSMLNGAASLQGVDFGTMNMTGFVASGSLQWANLSSTTGFQGSMLNGATSLDHANLSGLNLSGYSLMGASLNSANFSNDSNIPSNIFSNTGLYYRLSGANFSNDNLTGMVFPSNVSLDHVNFSGATGLTAAAIANNSSLFGVNLHGTGITKAALTAAIAANHLDTTIVNSITF